MGYLYHFGMGTCYSLCSLCWCWWLVLEWYERKILLAGWWLEAGAGAMWEKNTVGWLEEPNSEQSDYIFYIILILLETWTCSVVVVYYLCLYCLSIIDSGGGKFRVFLSFFLSFFFGPAHSLFFFHLCSFFLLFPSLLLLPFDSNEVLGQ